MVSEIPSRVKDSSPPVTTKVRPDKVWGRDSTSSATTRTPAALHLRIISRCQSILNQSMIDSAIVAPTPSICASSSALDFAIASIEPQLFASACAAVGPTWRIERATIVRQSGRVFASSNALRRVSTFLDGVPSF